MSPVASDREGAAQPAVVIVDDHALFRQGLAELLEEHGMRVVGQASDGNAAIRQVLALRPDVVLMDLNMPRRSGVDATRELASQAPATAVVILTVSAAEPDVIEALLAGASGYVLKEASAELILEAVRAAATGDAVISPQVAGRLIARLRQDAHRWQPPVSTPDFSARETEVLRRVARGDENAAIAADLHISPNTVKNHVSAILLKIGAANRVEAAVYAVRHGLL